MKNDIVQTMLVALANHRTSLRLQVLSTKTDACMCVHIEITNAWSVHLGKLGANKGLMGGNRPQENLK